MIDFSENMRAFTDRLKASIDDRADSLANTHEATTNLLDAARMFMVDVAHEHEARTEAVNDFMSRSHADRCETVKAMRETHAEELAAMSDEMRRMLDENMKSRTEYVADFMATSHADRCETARAMRDNHREEFATMREELHQTLDDANKTRLETVGMMRKTFQDAQVALATDLRAASTTWRQFAARRDQPTPRPAPTPVIEVVTAAPKAAAPRAAAPKTSHPQKAARQESVPDHPKGHRVTKPHRNARPRASS